jgi:mono/diheme cytochrome c family protein
MARRDTPLDDEKRSYGAVWLVLSLLLLVAGIWAIADDNVFRRPWKKYQAGFGRLEIATVKKQIADEQAKLDADETYRATKKRVDEAQKSMDSGDAAREIAALRAKEKTLKLEDLTKDLNLRFIKSELEEWRYHHDEALHHDDKAAVERWAQKIKDGEVEKLERQRIFQESQQGIEDVENEIKAKENELLTAQDELTKLTAKRDDLQGKLENISLGYLPGPKDSFPFFGLDWQPKIPKIQQVVLEEYDRNNYFQPVGRVERCTSCHSAIDKPGFEEQPNPWKTHPKRELYLTKHPTDKFGCTPCHNGDGVAVNSDAKAHASTADANGETEALPLREEHALFRKEKVQTNCIKCHAAVEGMEGVDVGARGEKLFVDLGCHGCHLAEGYEDLSKSDGTSVIGPSLRRIGAKADHGWLVRWITNPHEFRPRTRMPNFMFGSYEAQKDYPVQIAAFLLSTSKAPSDEWLAANPPVAVDSYPDLVKHGRELMDQLGCRGCHALAPDEVAGQLGANKDLAPNLSKIAEKTDARWIYHWIKNPRGFSHVARMPSLRLSDDEAKAITAYLVTLGQKQEASADLDARLTDPANVAAGEKLVRKFGCPGCHDIPGMEQESRIGAELTAFGGKTHEELFFGDRTKLKEDWDTWTSHKLKEPRGYETHWIEQVMPQFDLADDDVAALKVFLASRTENKVPAKYKPSTPGEKEIVEGRRLVARYNCTGCHIIEERGGNIRRLYENQLSQAPPNLRGEGKKVQSPWLYRFLKAPSPIRPWLKVRMPTFGLSDAETETVLRYFAALDHKDVPYTYADRTTLDPTLVKAGELLTSPDYMQCFSCHVRGTQMPQGEPDSWAPNLAMAATRLYPEWILEWLHDPQKLLPGTKMPSFYADPNAPDGPPDILNGDDEMQMRALRDYVVSIGLPEAQKAPQVADAHTAGATTTQ